MARPKILWKEIIYAKVHSGAKCRYQHIPKEDVPRFIRIRENTIFPPRSHDNDRASKNRPESEERVVNPIVWPSKKIQKVAVSTLSAEAMALAGTMDILAWCRLYWGWLPVATWG